MSLPGYPCSFSYLTRGLQYPCAYSACISDGTGSVILAKPMLLPPIYKHQRVCEPWSSFYNQNTQIIHLDSSSGPWPGLYQGIHFSPRNSEA